MQRPEWLLFDLGGVLVDNVTFERLSAIPQIGMTEAEIKSKWLASPTVRLFELGDLSPPLFAKRFVEEWKMLVEPEVFLADFAGWPKGFYPGAPELLADLRNSFKVACLSNSNSLHWARLNSLTKHFDLALSSHLLEAIKPDALCFERALQECHAAGQQAAFFDDSIENVIAARTFGLQAFHVFGLDHVTHVLTEQGWLR